jgi:hypothetical protein
MRTKIAMAVFMATFSQFGTGFATTSASAQIVDKNLTMKFNPVVARMNCERRGWVYKEVCVRVASPQNCDPSLAFGCQGECVETGMRCTEPGLR